MSRFSAQEQEEEQEQEQHSLHREMCDNPNTTHIVETECWQCPTRDLCNLWEKSYINRCNWMPITGEGRALPDGTMDGICNDGRDYIQLGGSAPVASSGWVLIIFAIGWLRKDRGKFAALRRHGNRVTARVISKSIEDVPIPTASGLPQVTEERAFLTVSWKPRPAVQRTMLGCLVYPRWDACKWHFHRILCCGRRRGACSRCCRPQSSGSAAWTRYRDSRGSGDVQYKMHVPSALYDRSDLTVRLMYDPWDDQNWVLPESAIGEPVPRLLFVAFLFGAGVSLVICGCVMVIDAFHCGPDFWGYPPCCNICYDWKEIKENTQICYRGACDGLGGKNQVYWCGNGVNEGAVGEDCYIGWSMVPMPAAATGIMLIVILTLLKNTSPCKPGSFCDRATNFLFGEGLFCCPDQPPREYREDFIDDPEQKTLLDYANRSTHLK
eukprot:SAG31_NODE_47_length_30979_cov_41.708841_5_plen_438_part_00